MILLIILLYPLNITDNPLKYPNLVTILPCIQYLLTLFYIVVIGQTSL
jgi:hypothetical protein